MNVARASRLPGRTRGHFIMQGPDGDVAGDTFTCPHCNSVQDVDRAATQVHICEHCHAPVCSSLECQRECHPFEKKLEEMERAAARAASRSSILRAAGIRE